MENKILFVGGNWNHNGGRGSKIVSLFASELKDVKLYNGGNYNELNDIIKSVINYDIVIWWANVDNNLEKIRNVKDINYKTMLVTSKRNIDNKYSFQDLLQRSLDLKANLTVEFSKKNNLYYMRLFDPLGNVWYKGTDIKECSIYLLDRLNFIKNITRRSTIRDNSTNLPNQIIKEEQFLNIVREYANKFSQVSFDKINVKRFLGNASFRCLKGFPSFKKDKYIYVSKRNVNKEFISINDFVLVYLDDDKVYYCGDNKPSVDTQVQVNLYKNLSNINYMIHSHCYINNAPFTEVALPCGSLEEVDEILKTIKKYYNNDLNRNFYLINLLGHGSIMMSSDVSKLNNIDIVGRNIPEEFYPKKLIKKKVLI